MTVVLSAGTVAGALSDTACDRPGRRLVAVGALAASVWGAAVAAGLTAGAGAEALTAALVPAGIAALAAGVAGVLRRTGVSVGTAPWLATAVVCLPSALIFVADPWIDWRGGTLESPERARTVLRASPLAAMTSADRGLGVDWQRMPMLYDGPAPGVPGLSLVGQFYPARPPAPWGWGLGSLAAGAALVALGRRNG